MRIIILGAVGLVGCAPAGGGGTDVECRLAGTELVGTCCTAALPDGRGVEGVCDDGLCVVQASGLQRLPARACGEPRGLADMSAPLDGGAFDVAQQLDDSVEGDVRPRPDPDLGVEPDAGPDPDEGVEVPDQSVPPPSGPDPNDHEATDARCGNGVDDDGDGFIDCDDFHCLYNPGVGVCPGARENDDATCSDGVDQDGNGFVDCDDFSCSQNPWVSVCGPREGTEETCSDGIDNDENGFVDCDDFGCSRSVLLGLCRDSEAGFCLNGRDDDADGAADCQDPDCEVAAACQ